MVAVFIVSAINGQDSDWKPIVGTTYTRISHRNPKVGTITLDSREGIVGSENTVTFHGSQFAADDAILANDGASLVTNIDTHTVGQSDITEDYEGRFLNGIGSSAVSAKLPSTQN